MMNLFTPLFLSVVLIAAGGDDIVPESDWEPYGKSAIGDQRELIITRREVPHQNPRHRAYKYRFVIAGQEKESQEVPWQPNITAIGEPGTVRPGPKFRAEWVKDGYVLFMIDLDNAISLHLVDLQPGEERPKLPGQPTRLLLISGFDGPAVESFAFDGSVEAGTFTVRAFGTQVSFTGELIRAVLEKHEDVYRWALRNPREEKR